MRKPLRITQLNSRLPSTRNFIEWTGGRSLPESLLRKAGIRRRGECPYFASAPLRLLPPRRTTASVGTPQQRCLTTKRVIEAYIEQALCLPPGPNRQQL